jgi:hypothetical protein
MPRRVRSSGGQSPPSDHPENQPPSPSPTTLGEVAQLDPPPLPFGFTSVLSSDRRNEEAPDLSHVDGQQQGHEIQAGSPTIPPSQSLAPVQRKRTTSGIPKQFQHAGYQEACQMFLGSDAAIPHKSARRDPRLLAASPTPDPFAASGSYPNETETVTDDERDYPPSPNTLQFPWRGQVLFEGDLVHFDPLGAAANSCQLFIYQFVGLCEACNRYHSWTQKCCFFPSVVGPRVDMSTQFKMQSIPPPTSQ